MKKFFLVIITLALFIFPSTASAKTSCNKLTASQLLQTHVYSVKCTQNEDMHIMIAVERVGYAVIVKRGTSPWKTVERVRLTSRPIVTLSKTTLQTSTFHRHDKIYIKRTWNGVKYVTVNTQREKGCDVLGSDFYAVITARNIKCETAQNLSMSNFPKGWACKVVGPSIQYKYFDEGRCIRGTKSFSWVMAQVSAY